MRRLNIYFVHSTKFDYNNVIYKKLLSSSVCLFHNLMLPMTKEYQEMYAKDLMEKADIIIAEVSNPSLGLLLELRWLQKFDKPKLFLCLGKETPKIVKKFVQNVRLIDEEDYLKVIENFINASALEEDQKGKEGEPVNLGEI